MAPSPLPSREPASGRNCYVTLAFSRVPSKRHKIKSGCIGGKDKTLDVQRKRISRKNFRRGRVLASKNTLKKPPWTIFKKGGGLQNPPRYRIFENTPPLQDPVTT